jgi:hypothetical protein
MLRVWWATSIGLVLAIFSPLAQSEPVDVNSDGIVGPHEVIDLSLSWKGPPLQLSGQPLWQFHGTSIYNTNPSLVGIGTFTPHEKLTIEGSAEIGTHHGDYQHLRIGGGNSSGFIYGSFPRFGDGIHFGYNYYADAAGNDRIIQLDGATSRITAGYGSVALATGGVGEPPVDRLVVDSVGAVKLGPNTQLFAPGGVENLRIIRGEVAPDGSTIAGTGFTVSYPLIGRYKIIFNAPFIGPPTVTATAVEEGSRFFRLSTGDVFDTTAELRVTTENGSRYSDGGFRFIAIGRRL